MSESDKMEFMQDNAELFKGQGGAELYDAFESGNYARIEQALKGNSALRNKLESQIAEIDKEISIQQAYAGEGQTSAYLEYLKE
jgi:hypothetical protein